MPASLSSIVNASGGAGYDANGNILSYTDSVTGAWSNLAYDGVNRLITGTQTAIADAPLSVSQSFCWSYDSFGNRTAQLVQSAACSSPAPTVTYNTSNQVTWVQTTAPAGFTYDAAGNVFQDNLNNYLSDAEGRICAVQNRVSLSATGYLYDASGARVAKGSIAVWSCDPSANGFQTVKDYIVGPGGEQMTEMGVDPNLGVMAPQRNYVYAAGVTLAAYDPDGLHFYLNDPLGTRRVQTDYAGVVEQTCSSLPFGDAESCSGGHLFTGKERDTESGNDYFMARYYSSAMGRFMSPDWSAKVEPVPYAKLDNPQSLNLYAYVLNNPLSHTDPDGHWCIGGHGTTCPPPPPDANHDHTLTVRQVSGQNGNPMGHITVQVDGHKEVGFTPVKDMTKTEIAENKSVPGTVEPRAKDVKTLDAVTIHLTKDEAKNAQATIDARTANPGDFQTRGRSCVDFGESVVHSTGAKAPSDDLPSHLIQDIRSQQQWDHSSQAP